MDDRQHESRHSWMAPVVWMLIALILYIGSVGPVAGLMSRGVIRQETFETFGTVIYYPMVLIDENSDFFQEHPIGIAYSNYVEWFEE